MTGRKELTPENVRKLVFDSIDLMINAQNEIALPVCPNIFETKKRLFKGAFKAEPFPQKNRGVYRAEHGSFEPPSTIILNSRLPFCDRPLDIPEIPYTLSYYTAIHEVIHADDYTGGDQIFKATLKHLVSSHVDKLRRGMQIIEDKGGSECINSEGDLARLWAMQYADMTANYRTYVILRHKKFPKLEFIWGQIQDDFFPASLLTRIERERCTEYIFNYIIGKAGSYCLIDALSEFTSIDMKDACKYTV